MGRPIIKYRDTAVICAKTAEPIDVPFALWARMRPRNHALDALDGGSTGAKGRWAIISVV